MKAREPQKISFALSNMQGFAAGLLGGFVYLVLLFSLKPREFFTTALQPINSFFLSKENARANCDHWSKRICWNALNSSS